MNERAAIIALQLMTSRLLIRKYLNLPGWEQKGDGLIKADRLTFTCFYLAAAQGLDGQPPAEVMKIIRDQYGSLLEGLESICDGIDGTVEWTYKDGTRKQVKI